MPPFLFHNHTTQRKYQMKLNLTELNHEFSDTGTPKPQNHQKPKKTRETEFDPKHRQPKKTFSRETLRRQQF